MITNRQDPPPPISGPNGTDYPNNNNKINMIRTGVVCCTTILLGTRLHAQSRTVIPGQ